MPATRSWPRSWVRRTRLQVDGIGGGHPLTSKVAVVAPSEDPRADVDYLFLQVWPDTGKVSADQTCGNILAGVGPFAIERGLVPASGSETAVRIRSLNGGGIAVATVRTPGGRVTYRGETLISGVSRPASPVLLAFDEHSRLDHGPPPPNRRAS